MGKKRERIMPYIFSGILTIIFLYLTFGIFLKLYFNKFYYKVPNFIGLTEENFKKIDLNKNLIIHIAGKDFSKLPAGTIFKQTPPANKIVKRGRTINVWISKGIEDYVMPDFTNKMLIEVSVALQKSGVKINHLSYTDSSLPYNTVIATTPVAGDEIQKSKGVSLLLSNFNSTSTIEIPDLIGFTLDDAKKELTDMGFIIGNIEQKKIKDFEANIVIDIKNMGKKVPAGTVINLVVSE